MNFSMLDEHSKMNSQGTGLGLSICKRMIEQMGGTVSVKSKVNVGTTFTINLVTKAQLLANFKDSERFDLRMDVNESLQNSPDPENENDGKVEIP